MTAPDSRLLLAEFGARVRAQRLARGLSQEELAERAGWSAATVGRIELGKSDAGITAVYALARVLDVGLGELLPELGSGATAPTPPSDGDWQRVAETSTSLARKAEEMIRFAARFDRPAKRRKRPR
jgi:transcriptional regulator with XRE-family HTH domain